jgi:hypothetical protein
MIRQRVLFVAALVTACGVAACSSGGTVGTTLPPGPGGGGGTNISSITLTGSTQSVPLPAFAGLSGTVSVPSGTGTAQLTVSTSPGGGAVGIQTGDKRPATAANAALAYLTITATGGPLTISGIPGASITLASAPSGSVYEALGTLNGTYFYWHSVGSALSVTGAVVTVPTIPGSVTIAAGQSLYIAIYKGSAIVPPVQPIGIGNTYAFAGSLTTNTVYTYPTALPTAVPSVVPSGMPPLNGTATVSTTIAVQAAPTPFWGATGTTDFHSVETDAYALRSNVATTDAWYANAANGFQLFGSSSNDGAGDTVTTEYAAPFTLEALPESNGASWTNDPAEVIHETDADGTHSTRVYASNGTYTETQTVPASLTAIITVNADGSGTYSGTAFYTFSRTNGFSFSTPSPTGVITVAIVHTPPPPPLIFVPPPTTVATPAVWYPVPFVPYTETDSLALNKTIDGRCALSNAFGVSGSDVTQAIQRVDPVLGYVESQMTDTYYVTGIGVVCVVMADTQTYHYNYNNDDGTLASAAAVFGTGNTKSTTSATEVVSLQTTNGIVPTSSGKTAAGSLTGGQSVSSIAIAYTRAQFDARMDVVRRAHANAMRDYVEHVIKNLEVAR